MVQALVGQGEFDLSPDVWQAVFARAVGVPVEWEDRETFRIVRPAPDTVERVRSFLGSYPR